MEDHQKILESFAKIMAIEKKPKVKFCDITGKEFSKELNTIYVNKDKFTEIVNWFTSENVLRQTDSKQIPFCFNHAIVTHEEDKGTNSVTSTEYEIKGNTLFVTLGVVTNGKIVVGAKYKYNVNTLETVDVSYNYKMKQYNEESFNQFVYVSELSKLDRITLNQLKAIMWYIATFNKVVDVKETEIEIKPKSRKKNKTRYISDRDKPIKIIKTVYIKDVPMNDLTYKRGSVIKRNYKPCEYEFQRRGHWAQSKKTGKRWWVSESTVNKGKGTKKEGRIYEV